jgi:flagellar motor protein MotB
MNVFRAGRSIMMVAGLLCISMGCQNKLADENDALHKQNRELQERLNEDDAKLRAANAASVNAADPAALTAAQSEIAALNQKIAELQANLQAPQAGGPAQPGLSGIQATYDAAAGTLTVNLPGDVLFDSGKAVVKGSAQPTLEKIIAAVNKDYRGKRILIEGYTDTDPISRSRDQWDDNWDLSYGRAKAVEQYLTSHGVDAKHVAIVANGPNKSKSTKPASRRVEIVVSTR